MSDGIVDASSLIVAAAAGLEKQQRHIEKLQEALTFARGRDIAQQLRIDRLESEVKALQVEVERAKADRNRAGLDERRKYLPRLGEMAALLDRASHAERFSESDGVRCAEPCARCEWEKLKAVG